LPPLGPTSDIFSTSRLFNQVAAFEELPESSFLGPGKMGIIEVLP
jgi:hypothetical protein